MIDLTRAIKYPFQGKNALNKIVIGALFYLLSPFFLLTLMILLGYQLRVVRDVMNVQDGEGLPVWTDIGRDFVEGIKVFAGSLLYYLPSIILVMLGAQMAWHMLSETISSLDVIDMVTAHQGMTVTIDRAEIGMICLLFTLALLWMVISAPLIMTAVARYAETENLATFVNIGQNFSAIWANRGAAGMLMLNLFVLGITTQVASAIVSMVPMGCVLGGFVNFIQLVAIWHLTGQWGTILKEHRPKQKIIRPIEPPPFQP